MSYHLYHSFTLNVSFALTLYGSAAQAWNRNDARAAKTLSIRGQAENDAMRRCYREAAKHLYEAGLKNSNDDDENELYVDLHGFHPGEAIQHLEKTLSEQASFNRRLLYAVAGSVHQSKSGKDKVAKVIKGWLNQSHYVFREFNAPGERGGYIGILGIDPTSRERNLASMSSNSEKNTETGNSTAANSDENSAATSTTGPTLTMGKIQLLKRDDAVKAG